MLRANKVRKRRFADNARDQNEIVSPIPAEPVADPDPYPALEGLQPNIMSAGVKVVHDPINIAVVAFRLVGHISPPRIPSDAPNAETETQMPSRYGATLDLQFGV
jgi:hypothetical protein